jgi:hypothetical protein
VVRLLIISDEIKKTYPEALLGILVMRKETNMGFGLAISLFIFPLDRK